LLYSMVYDHTRSRLWWVSYSKIYMADIRNQQIKTYDITLDLFKDAKSIKVDLASGNVFVVVTLISSNDRYLIQMSRDNNVIVASAYLEI
jgi:hypothetical protein